MADTDLRLFRHDLHLDLIRPDVTFDFFPPNFFAAKSTKSWRNNFRVTDPVSRSCSKLFHRKLKACWETNSSQQNTEFWTCTKKSLYTVGCTAETHCLSRPLTTEQKQINTMAFVLVSYSPRNGKAQKHFVFSQFLFPVKYLCRVYIHSCQNLRVIWPAHASFLPFLKDRRMSYGGATSDLWLIKYLTLNYLKDPW